MKLGKKRREVCVLVTAYNEENQRTYCNKG